MTMPFHELVHVVQWSRLGVERFLLAYGFGLIRFGYYHGPLEEMAYALERDFERGAVPQELVGVIEGRTDAVWNQAAPVVLAGRNQRLSLSRFCAREPRKAEMTMAPRQPH